MSGGIDFNGADFTGPAYNASGYRFQALVSSSGEFSLGSPEAVIAQVVSQLLDGDPQRQTRRGNRTITLPVAVECDPRSSTPVGTILDTAAADLERLCTWTGYAEMTYTGELEGAKPRVYEMWTADPAWEWSDLDEEGQKRRIYLITIEARPFARSVEPTTFLAPPIPAPDPLPSIVITDGSSVSNITLQPSAFGPSAVDSVTGPTSASGVVSGTARIVGNGPGALKMRAAGSASADYAGGTVHVLGGWSLAKVALASSPRTMTLNVWIDDAVIWSQPVGMTAAETSKSGSIDVTIPVPVGGIATSVAIDLGGGPSYNDITLRLDSVAVDPPVLASRAVQSRQVVVPGTQRTDLSLQLLGLDDTDTAEALGAQVVVHSAPAAALPPFYSTRATASVNTAPSGDSACLSGGRNDITTDPPALGTSPLYFTFDRADIHADTYRLLARIRATTSETRTVTVSTDGESQSTSVVASVPATWPSLNVNEWRIIPLGEIRLPAREATSGTFSVLVAASAAGLQIDDLYLFSTSGELTILDTSDTYDGHAVERVELRAASTDSATRQVWFGTADAGYLTKITDASTIHSAEQHQGIPGVLQVTSICDGCTTARLSAVAYERGLL